MIPRGAYGQFGDAEVMRDPEERASRWIGLTAFFIGAVLVNGSLPADMLPINRALFAVDCALVTAWLLLLAVRSGDGRQ